MPLPCEDQPDDYSSVLQCDTSIHSDLDANVLSGTTASRAPRPPQHHEDGVGRSKGASHSWGAGGLWGRRLLLRKQKPSLAQHLLSAELLGTLPCPPELS